MGWGARIQISADGFGGACRALRGLEPLGLSLPQDTEDADLGSRLEVPKQSTSHLMQQGRSEAMKCLHFTPRELHGRCNIFQGTVCHKPTEFRFVDRRFTHRWEGKRRVG